MTGGRTPNRRTAYFMGKDNIVFHTVIWPSMLLGYGKGASSVLVEGDLHLPDEVVASEFLTMEGKQLSTSRAIAIYVRDVLERYDPDPVRYFLDGGRPGDSRQRLLLGRVPETKQRRATRQLGQSRQPDTYERAPEFR